MCSRVCVRFRNFHLLSGHSDVLQVLLLPQAITRENTTDIKVYWEDGAQVTPPHDTGIMAEVAKVNFFDMVKTMEKEKAQAEGLYQIISDDVDESYFAELRNLSIHPEIIKKMAKDIKIVYTPLHGTGLPVKRVC